ncbi:hypothetical protein [Paenisporosarcina sp. OV554]|uniref:hypothetical protein n=1 Tax=Paenisporosarcina sp. OV554 TaxID=2135694 RepID=UPI000D4C0F38|nr:hypothetical protein [Paenisporosarcina sp. OV554]PUB12890.1 hypothetical protein C8K15_1082 [Paenisporosarcina sp. OV554]
MMMLKGNTGNSGNKGNKRSLLVGGLASMAYLYFQKPENRDKAKMMLQNTLTKVSCFMDSRNVKQSQMTKAGFSDPNDPDDNRMVEEGSMTSVRYYNEEVQSKDSKSEAKQAFPKSQQKPASVSKESLPEDNNDSPAKQENAKRNPPS